MDPQIVMNLTSAVLPLWLRVQSAATSAVRDDNGPFLPHGTCYLWNKPLLLTHLTSDLLIGLSYVAISLSLAYLVHRARKDIPFSMIFIAFGLFIVACGMTHFMEVWTLWHPAYWAAGMVKVVTAAASVSTAIAMPFAVPKVILSIRDNVVSREREVARARSVALQEHNALLETQALELEEAALRSEQLTVTLEETNKELVRALAEAHEARVAAENASRVKSDFLAVMSHELRTPLNAIIGYEELLSGGMSGPVSDVQQHQLGRIRMSAMHLRGLIDEVLTLSRLDAGAIAREREEISVATMLDEAHALVQSAADAKGLTMRVETPAHDATIVSDSLRLRQILVNLLTNAIKFTERGEVVLKAEARNGEVRFTVADSGIGIAPENFDRIFDPFWQAGSSRTRTAGGAGLGLSVAQRLGKMLGGSLELASSSPAGSTFVLTLPIDADGQV